MKKDNDLEIISSSNIDKATEINNENKKGMTPRKIVSVFCLVAAFCIAIYIIFDYNQRNKSQDILENLAEETVVEEPEEIKEPEVESIIPKKNINWDKLKETNEDIYAWIYIPKESELTGVEESTEDKKEIQVDYPVLQDPEDDYYYLDYNIDGSKGYPGCIYTEHTYNSKDFTDCNTILYGHNMKDGSMFAGLHLFEDDDFYNNNRYVFIYTPTENYAYEIFAAMEIDDRHLLHGWDFEQDGIMEAYRDYIGNIKHYGNFDSIDVTDEDKFITLSTCTSAARGDDTRYIVVGKRVEIQENDKNTSI